MEGKKGHFEKTCEQKQRRSQISFVLPNNDSKQKKKKKYVYKSREDAGDQPFSMVPYLPKAAARDSSLVSKLSPPINSLPSSDIFSVAEHTNQRHVIKKNNPIQTHVEIIDQGDSSRGAHRGCTLSEK